MKKRLFSLILALCLVITMVPVSVFAEEGEPAQPEAPVATAQTAPGEPAETAAPTQTGETVEPAKPTETEATTEAQEPTESPVCTCETPCAAEAMNPDCAICSAEGAKVEDCGKYIAPEETTEAETQPEPFVCTCEVACAAEAMNADCPVCGAEGATIENCGKYEAPVEETEPEQTAIEKVQALINALPDADTITEENRADVEAQLTAIDEAKFPLEDEWDALDFTKYNDAIAALNELDGIGGAEIPEATAEATAESYFVFDKNTGTITGVTNDLPTEIVIPDTIDGVAVTTIERSVFRNCTGLTSITIPNSVTTIGEAAFDYCDGLTSITIPNSVTTIGEYAFRECNGLASITIPNSVTTIGVSAFEDCDGLTSITIPNSVTTIGVEAFRECTGLTSITISNSVTTIERSVFRNCTGLTSITIPNSVTTIGEAAFRECTGLTSITIPNSVTTIGEGAFGECLNLTNAYYLGTNEEWNVLLPNIGNDNWKLTNAVKCIAYNESVNLVYDGEEKEVYTSQTDGVTIKYYQGTNEVSPINAGTYTAKVGNDEIGTFTITKADQVAPNGLADTAETIDGKADGKITGVTTAMEYRKESDTDYTAITGTEITGLVDGKYYIRYKADDNHNASADAEVTIAVGRKLTVTVPTTQVGYTLTVNKTELVWNDSMELTFALADGYSKLDTFAVNVNRNPITLDANGEYTVTDVQSDITVTVAGVVEIFTITFDPNGGTVDPTGATTDAEGKLGALPTPTRTDGYRFDGWFTAKTGGTKVTVNTVFTAHTTLYARWAQKVERLDFGLSGHGYKEIIMKTKVIPGAENLGATYGDSYEEYGLHYGITNSLTDLEPLSSGVFEAEKTYYVYIRFYEAQGYALDGLKAGDVFLNGVAAESLEESETAQGWIARFKLPVIFTVKIVCGKNGSITYGDTAYKGSKTVIVPVFEGEDATFTITPNAGYARSKLWIDEEQQKKTVKTYTFEDVQESHTLRATFAKASDNPKTGDQSYIDLALDAMFIAAGALAALLILRKKKGRR